MLNNDIEKMNFDIKNLQKKNADLERQLEEFRRGTNTIIQIQAEIEAENKEKVKNTDKLLDRKNNRIADLERQLAEAQKVIAESVPWDSWDSLRGFCEK